jgi:diguanylate cyclase (GGDEF)-like protein
MRLAFSLATGKFRRAFLVYHSMSVILPLLIIIFSIFKYVYPHLYADQIESLRGTYSYIFLIVLSVTILSFFFLSVWVKSIEKLTADAKNKFAEIMPERVEFLEENEIAILRKLFGSFHKEIQEKVAQLNVYSQKLVESNIKLSELAITDGLTGLYNRRYLDKRLDEEISRSLRYDRDLSLIMFDVDGFKPYNDMHGHQEGDKLLKDLARLTSSNIRESDIPFRYGGDEFAIICTECSMEDARRIAERLIEAFASRQFTYTKDQAIEKVTISCGVAANGREAKGFVAEADRLLYKAKTSGKGKVAYS